VWRVVFCERASLVGLHSCFQWQNTN